jgi:hypothetical protein
MQICPFSLHEAFYTWVSEGREKVDLGGRDGLEKIFFYLYAFLDACSCWRQRRFDISGSHAKY